MTETTTGLDTAQTRASALIDELDLESIVYKLMHPEPGETAMTLAEADQLTGLYRCFLKLCAWYPDEAIVPSKRIDEVWHLHLLDTAKWADDSVRVFGSVVHHFPYFGLRGPRDEADLRRSYERTRCLFRRHFGTDPAGSGGPSCSTSCSAGGNQCSAGGCHQASLNQDRPRPDRTATAAGAGDLLASQG